LNLPRTRAEWIELQVGTVVDSRLFDLLFVPKSLRQLQVRIGILRSKGDRSAKCLDSCRSFSELCKYASEVIPDFYIFIVEFHRAIVLRHRFRWMGEE